MTLASSGTGKYVFKCSARNSDGIYVNNTDASTTSTLNLNGDVEINVQASVNSAIHAYATAGNAIVNINGGKITATGSGKQFKAIHVDQNATLNMAGGELDITVDFDSYSDNNDVVGVLIFGNSSKQENCHVVISDGIFKVGGKNAFAQVVQVGMVNGYSENCDVSITGGTVKLEPTENGTGYVYAPYKASYATAAISGGTVTGTVTALVNAYISDVTNDGLTVTGGTFPTGLKDSIEKHLGEGCTMDANGTVSSSATPATGVATVGGVSYDTLEKAFAALSDTAHTLTLNDESAWNTATPVYWKAGDGEYSAAATLVDALTEAYKANAGDITIICRPGADVGEMTHGHVADNLTIYGNDAYISGGECELEVDTFKFDRNTGKQATDGVTLDKDITITAYELDNLGVWGQRNTGYTVNVNLTDCDTVQGITVQRVYISGTTGMNNITLTGCDFETKATSVYSNADGDINITNCSFTGAQVPVNFNHKTDGEQTLRVSNCEFNACGDAGEWKQFAAPVRFVNSGSGKQSATVDTCTFTDTVGPNGDILIGDGRTGQESNDVNLTITDTEAKIQAQKPGYYKDDGTTDNALKGEKKLTASESLTNASIDSLIGGTTATKGSETNPYTLEELGAMTRAEYIAAQKELGGTMYVSVGNYNYDTDGVLGNGVRDDTPGQIPDHSKLNAYGENGYLGEKNDGANGLNIVFVNGSITSGVTGYTSIDNIGTSLLLAVPAYTNVTFKGITFNNVMSFNYQLYTGPWSQLGELKFEKCTFNGIIVGAIAAQTLTFNGCTFNDYTNETSANSSNPTWIRPAYGNWKESDNEGQGENFKSLTTINFTNNNVTSTRPVKFEFISQWNKTTTLTATGNTFDISAQESDTETKNVGLYIGPHTDKNAVKLVLDNNTKSEGTAALYVIPKDMSKLPVGSTVKDSSGTEIEITDALEWKTNNPITLKTEPVPVVKNVAMVGDTEYATLEDAIAKAEAGQTVTLITDVNTPEKTYVVSKNLTIDLNGKTVTGSGYDGVFQIDGKDVKVLIENGNVVAVEKTGSAGKYAMAVWACAENCEVTLEDLTVTQDITHTDDKQMDMIYTSKGKIIINSGSFTSGTPAWTLNCKDAAFKDGSAKIIVNGGTFTGFDPCNNAAEGKGTSFVAEGVGVDYDENGSFTAKAGMVAQVLDASGNSVKAYKTLAEAFTEASEGQTVRLLANATEDVTIDKNITLDLGGKMLTNTNAGKATITIAKGATATVKNGSVVGGTSYYNLQNNGTATFEGLTATAGNNGSSMIDNWGTLTITSGTYTGGLNVVKSEEGSKLTINGGKFTLEYATNGYTGVIFAYGDTTITGGEFIQSLTTTGRWNHPQVIATGVVEGHPAITRVTGGMFTNKMSGEGIFRGVGKGTSDNFEVSGGTFNKSIPESFCADGFIPTKNADGTYGVKEGKYVAKIGSTSYETLAAAIAKANSKSKPVTLVADVTESIEIAESKTCKIDLNGFTLTNTEGSHTIVNNGTLTIMDSSAAKSGKVDNVTHAKAAIVNYGTMTLAGGTYTRSKEDPDNNKDSGGKNSYYTILNDKGGSLTIEDGVTVTNVGHFSSMIRNGGDAEAQKESILIIKGGNFSGGINTVKNDEFGKLTISGGSFSNTTQCVVMNWNEASITGGTLELASGVNSTLLFSVSWSEHAIGKMTISGGTFKYTETQGLVQDTYNGGQYSGTLAVSGGKFTSAVPENYCADGYVPTKNEDGTFGVKVDDSVAEVGGVKYLSLQAAIDAAGRKQTVKLLKDTTENVTMATPYLTLDLNGHTLNGSTGERKPALTVTARVTVMDSSADMSGTIMREDTEKNSGVSSHYVIDVQGDGWLTFESGNVINNSGNDAGKGASLVRVGDDSVANYPGLNIKGGNFKQNNFIAIKVDCGTFYLNGGTITSENSYAIENWWNAIIKGGTVYGDVATWVYSGGKAFSDLEIKDSGTVNGNVASVTYDKAEGKTAKVTISGGTVTGTLGTYTYSNGLVPLHDPAKATIGVTGGTFDIDPTPYVVEGSTVKKDETTGKYGVEKAYLAKVGETSYYTMDEAFHAAVASGETLYLLRDYTTNSEQNSGSNSFTIDLNGFTWTYTGTDTNYAAFEINYPNVTLTVKNGTVVSNSMVGLIPSAMGGTITYDNSGLVFESVQATANGHSGIETNGNNTNDTVTLKDSTLNVPKGFGIYFPSSGKLTIDNSKITAKTLGVQVCSGSLDIKGADTKIEVTGDPVPKTENDGAIQDGAAISIVNRTGYKGLGTITVTEGTFKAKSGNAAVKAYNWANQAESDFTESNKVAISGGTFSSAVAPEYCAEGFEPKDNGDGTYGVQPDGNVAEIGSVKYASLDEALKAAKDRETVKLLKDVEATQVLVTKGTLDLNGKTLKVSYFMSFSDVIDSTEGNGLIETGVQSFFTTNNSYLPLRDSAANGYRLFSYKLNKLGVVEGSSTAFWFNIIFGGEKAYSLLNTAGHNADLFIPMQIGSGNEWQYIKMNQSTLMKWTTPILNGTAPSKCGYYVNITGLDTLTSGTVLTLKTSIRSCGVEKLSDDSLTYTVK